MKKLIEDPEWIVAWDGQGLILQLGDEDLLDSSRTIKAGAEISERAALLRIMLEQGTALPIKGGAQVPWITACGFSASAREAFELPEPWPGGIKVVIRGRSTDTKFDLGLQLVRPDGEVERGFSTEGGMITLGSMHYLADTLQLTAFQAEAALRGESERSQFTNLRAVKVLQDASGQGLDIDLEAFDELPIVQPDAVRVALEERNDGSLTLTPDLCAKEQSATGASSVVDPVEFESRCENYIGEDQVNACVPVGKRLILLDEKAVNAVREITKNKHIPADHKEAFLRHPTAWLSANIVDLDLGFSVRVRGAAPFRLAYFGETDESGINWLEAKPEPTPTNPEGAPGEPPGDPGGEAPDPGDVAEPLVLDIELADEGDAPDEIRSITVPERSLVSALPTNPDALLRKPFPHQEQAIRWLMALAMDESRDSKWAGALLADDMGLGKTFSVLVFLREYVRARQSELSYANPVLIVAPVSLLNVWEEEISKSYRENPFQEILVLHGSRDLPRFKLAEGGRETQAREPESNAGVEVPKEDLQESIHYALRVAGDGASPTPDHLGLPNTLVITNYETVRDYQFSLARVRWSAVVLDEAQQVKNPNAMTTRAVKALNADFCVLMTGTPVENNLRDFWCLMDRAQPGFLNNYQPFRREFITPISRARNTASPEELADLRNQIGGELRERVAGFMLRRLKEQHLDGLPEKTVILHNTPGDRTSGYDERILCVMSDEQKTVYDDICQQASEQSAAEDSSAQGAVLRALQHLRAASLHPGLVFQDSLTLPRTPKEASRLMSASGKLVKLLEILEQIARNKEKALIFVINKKLQMFLQHSLQLYFEMNMPPSIINGDTKISSKRDASSTRTQIIKDFSDREGFDVLILSPVAAGVGLTITAANHVIHLERHWNPAKEAQATDRVYRIGQTKSVTVWVPILSHPDLESFDQKLDQLLSMKSGLSEAVVTPEPVSPGDLLGVFGRGKSDNQRMITIEDVAGLSPELFEALIAAILSGDRADRVILTQNQNDKGCDVVAIGWAGANWLFQCKHKRNPKSPIGHTAVREIVGSRRYYQDCLQVKFDQLAVFSNARKFSREARKLADLENVELLGAAQIRKLLSKNGIPLGTLLRFDGDRKRL